jgi:hypothetical protein
MSIPPISFLPMSETESPIPTIPTTAPKTSTTTNYIRDEQGNFQCPFCEKKSEKQNTMYYHIKKNHHQDYKYICPHCPGEARKFVQRSAYLQHLANGHPDEAAPTNNPYIGVSYSCPCCEHTAKTKANILIHYARTHCKDWIPPFTKGMNCKSCDKQFASSTAYLYHAVQCIPPSSESNASCHFAALNANASNSSNSSNKAIEPTSI